MRKKKVKTRSKWLSIVLPIFVVLGFRLWGVLFYIILYFVFRKKEKDFATTMLLSASATMVVLLVSIAFLWFWVVNLSV